MNLHNCMKSFIAAASERSFSEAGRKLTVSKVQISRDISKLEDFLGVKLFNRSTRALSLTTIGKVYFEQAKYILAQINDLHDTVSDKAHGVKGVIKVLAPNSLTEMFLMPIFLKFKKKYPEVSIQLKLSHTVFDIVKEGFDIAIRAGELKDSNLICRKISEYHVVTCASPEYLDIHGIPKSPSDLKHHQIFIDPIIDPDFSWKFANKKSKEIITFEHYFSVDSAQAVRKALLLHSGIGRIPLFAVIDDLKSGRLISLFDEYDKQKRAAYVLYPNRDYIPKNVSLLINELASIPKISLSTNKSMPRKK